MLVKSVVHYLPLWKGNFMCLYLKAANARGIFFIIIILLILKTMSWTSLSLEIVQFQTLCCNCTARSLPGPWHYQQKMQLLKEWIIVLEGPLEGGEDTKTDSERQNLALQRNGSKNIQAP